MTLKEVKGQISDISKEKRKIAIETKEKEFVILEWVAGLDTIMAKQKEHWFVQITYEEVNGVNIINTIAYWEKPADWPQRQPLGGRKSYGKSPEERKDIRLMACLKAATEIFSSPLTFSDEGRLLPLTYEEVCIEVAKAAVNMESVLSGETK